MYELEINSCIAYCTKHQKVFIIFAQIIISIRNIYCILDGDIKLPAETLKHFNIYLSEKHKKFYFNPRNKVDVYFAEMEDFYLH